MYLLVTEVTVLLSPLKEFGICKERGIHITPKQVTKIAEIRINMNKMHKTEYLKSYVCAVNMFIQYIPQACNKRILVTRNHKMLMEKHEKENS